MSAAAYEAIVVERCDAGYATLILNRPDKLNALSTRMRQEIGHAVAALEADPHVHVLILTGTGRAFTAGLDLDEPMADAQTSAAIGAHEHDPVAALLRFSGPVIGAINGLAITGGLEIALACDMLIAASEARFADTHAKVGLLPGWGGSVRLVHRVGLSRAKELALTGRFLGADEALAWGLVNHVVPAAELQAKAQDLARQMLGNVRDTVHAYKRLLDDEAVLPFAQALALERSVSLANNRLVGRETLLARLDQLRRRR
jgi:enoyl-CoA hydratase